MAPALHLPQIPPPCLFTCFSLRIPFLLLIFKLFLQLMGFLNCLPPQILDFAMKHIVKVIIKNIEKDSSSEGVADMPRKLNYKRSLPLLYYAVVK